MELGEEVGMALGNLGESFYARVSAQIGPSHRDVFIGKCSLDNMASSMLCQTLQVFVFL